jgi:DNA primase catalytic core
MSNLTFRDLIETLREKLDIADVIGQYIDLDHNNMGLCPFHDDSKPSFSVNSGGKYFHCFSCGVGGDVFRFIELFEGKSFRQVLSELAQQVGLSVPSPSPGDLQDAEEKRAISDILRYTAWFYYQTLSDEAREYLNKRGITDETIANSWIGYANGGLYKYLVSDWNFPLDLCLKAGVLKKSSNGMVRDYFNGRVIFPNFKHGQVMHLSARSLDDQEPRYLHLPGEMHYLFNEDALSANEVYVAEGILDCLSLIQAGYPAVAIYGTGGFKREYLSKFSRCRTIYLCLDADDAGREAAIRVGGIIGEQARVVQLPDGFDLNDYFLAHSKEEFETLVASSMDVIKFELSFIPTDTDKTQLPGMLASVLQKLAGMDRARAEAFLNYDIRDRFGLKATDIQGYRELLNQLRRETAIASDAQSSSTDGNAIYTACFEGLVDIVEHSGAPTFLVREGNNILLAEQIELDGITYVPPLRKQLPWLLPRADEVLKYYDLRTSCSDQELDAQLYDDLLVYHRSISELPGEAHYDLIAAWDMHTYLLEGAEFSPIICFFALPERGKSRTGKGMIHVAYRGIHVESLRDPYIVRVANDLQATLFFDVRDLWNTAVEEGSEDVILHRYERGATVPRVNYPERGAHRDIVYYSVFGPTLLATNEAIDWILETRAVQVSMPETSIDFQSDVTRRLALPLKERLVAFRARHLGQTLPDMRKPASGRLGDILKPLVQIIRLVRPEREAAFLSLIEELQTRKIIERVESLEAEILVVILQLEPQVINGVLAVKQITDTFNAGKSDREKLTNQKIGRKLSAMGFQKSRTGTGASAILWDVGKIVLLRQRYGV